MCLPGEQTPVQFGVVVAPFQPDQGDNVASLQSLFSFHQRAAELDEHSRIALARVFASELADRYGTAACWAVHRPDRRGDRRPLKAQSGRRSSRLPKSGIDAPPRVWSVEGAGYGNGSATS